MLLLKSRFPENIKLYTATLENELLAGVVMYLSKTVAHCQYIGASPAGKDSKALTLLFSHLIDEYKNQGYRYFDFGISNEDHGRYLNEGLVRQKSRLGGRGIVYNTFDISL
jgi:lipid II:glycine glycyltransferase (peptidoglycan interpeptide bridge formation enzyme)